MEKVGNDGAVFAFFQKAFWRIGWARILLEETVGREASNLLES
jgi:hypothetical protein